MTESGLLSAGAWWPPSPHSGGPGEHKHGSVRPRGRSLRPDGVRTVPTVARTVSRGREGVNVQRCEATRTCNFELVKLPQLRACSYALALSKPY